MIPRKDFINSVQGISNSLIVSFNGGRRTSLMKMKMKPCSVNADARRRKRGNYNCLIYSSPKYLFADFLQTQDCSAR
jgi:hypothetical protein